MPSSHGKSGSTRCGTKRKRRRVRPCVATTCDLRTGGTLRLPVAAPRAKAGSPHFVAHFVGYASSNGFVGPEGRSDRPTRTGDAYGRRLPPVFLGRWALRVGCWVFSRTPKGSKTIAQGNALGFQRPNNAMQAEGLQEAFEFLQPFRLQVAFWFSQSRGVAPGYVLAPFQGAGADRVRGSLNTLRIESVASW